MMINIMLLFVNISMLYIGAVNYLEDNSLTGAATVLIATISLVITLLTQFEGILLRIRKYYLYLKRRDIPCLLRKMLADGKITIKELLEMVDAIIDDAVPLEEKIDDKSK